MTSARDVTTVSPSAHRCALHIAFMAAQHVQHSPCKEHLAVWSAALHHRSPSSQLLSVETAGHVGSVRSPAHTWRHVTWLYLAGAPIRNEARRRWRVAYLLSHEHDRDRPIFIQPHIDKFRRLDCEHVTDLSLAPITINSPTCVGLWSTTCDAWLNRHEVFPRVAQVFVCIQFVLLLFVEIFASASW